MAKRVEITNPRGLDSSSEYMVFPSYYPLELIEDEVRERFPDKYWPEEAEEEKSEELPSGFWGEFAGAFGESYEQSNEDLGMGLAILNASETETINMLEDEYQKWKAEPESRKQYPILSGGFLGETFGSVTRDVGVGVTLGGAASVATTPLGGLLVGGTTVATLQSLTAKGGSFRNTYFGERYKQDQSGVANIEDAYNTARDVSNIDSLSAAAEAIASTTIPIPGFGKGLTKVGTKLVDEMAFDAAIGATGSALSDAYAVSKGVDRGDRVNNAARAALQEVIGGSVPTAIRGVTEWGKYTTNKRFIEQRLAEERAKLKDLEEALKSQTQEKEKTDQVVSQAERVNTTPIIPKGNEISYLSKTIGLPKTSDTDAIPERVKPDKQTKPKRIRARRAIPAETAETAETAEPTVEETQESVEIIKQNIAKLTSDLEKVETGNSEFVNGSLPVFDWTSVDFDNEITYGPEYQGEGGGIIEGQFSPLGATATFIRPNTSYVTIPLYDEEGVLNSTRIATRKEVEALRDKDKIPNLWVGDILQDPSVPNRSIIPIDGRYHELFSDGSVSKAALNSNWINPDGSVPSKNKGGQVSPNFQVPVSRVQTWSGFLQTTTETNKNRADKLIEGLKAGKKYDGGRPMQGRGKGKYYPLLDPFVRTDGIIEWRRLFETYQIESNYEGLPESILELETKFLNRAMPDELTALVNRLSLGDAVSENRPDIKGGEAITPRDTIAFHATSKTQQTITDEAGSETFDVINTAPIEVPINSMESTGVDIESNPSFTKNVDETERLLRLVLERKKEIEAFSIQEDGNTLIASPSRKYTDLVTTLSHPEDKTVGPYAHWGDSSKILKEEDGATYLDANREYAALSDLEFSLFSVMQKHKHYEVESLLNRLKTLRTQTIALLKADPNREDAVTVSALKDLNELSSIALRFGLHQKGMVDFKNVDYLDILSKLGSERVGVDQDFRGITDFIPLKNLDPEGVFYANTENVPNIISPTQEKSKILRNQKFVGDFAELETRLQNILKYRWLNNNYGTQFVPEIDDASIANNENLYTQIAAAIDAFNAKDNPINKEGKSVKAQMELALAENFVDVSTLINSYLETAKSSIYKNGKNVPSGKAEEAGFLQHMKNVSAGFLALNKMSGALNSNLFFNPAAIPQIYNSLVDLAAFLSKKGINSVTEFAKAIGTSVTDVVKFAWEDGVKGVYRGMYTLPSKVIKSIINMLTPSRELVERMTPANMLELTDSWWESFVDRYSLQEHAKKGKIPAVKALLNRNFVNRYYDLAEIMARVGVGLEGSSLEERLSQIGDSVNAYYKLDGLEALLGEKMTEFNSFKQNFQDELVSNGIDLDEFDQFLYAKHAPSRNRRMAEKNSLYVDYQTDDKTSGSGMSDESARNILSEIDAKGKTALYEKIAEKYIYSLTTETLQIQLEGGLITPKTYDILQSHYDNYVPLRGKENQDFVLEQTGNGIEVRGPEMIRALGRSTRADNIISYTFQQYANAVIRAERNKVMQSLRAFAIRNKNDEIKVATPNYVRKLAKIDDEFGGGEMVKMVNDPLWHRKHDVIALKVKGVNKYLRVANPALAHELRNSGVSSIQEYTRGVGQMTKWLSRVNTQYNPSFIIPNLLRDIQFAKANLSATESKELARELANIWNLPGIFTRGKIEAIDKNQGVIWDALSTAMRYADPLGRKDKKNKKPLTPEQQKKQDEWDAVYKEMRENGGRITFYGRNDFESQVATLRKLSKQINAANAKAKNSKNKTVQAKALALSKKLVSQLGEIIEGVNSGMESASRLATYKLAREKGMSPQKAAYLSRNITVNFTRKGKYGSALNNLFMFFNASIQGSYNMYKSLKHSDRGQKVMFNIMAAGFLAELLNQMVSGEDEESRVSYYSQIPEWKKKTNFVIMNPFNGKEAISIPMPYGYNVLHYTGAKTAMVLKQQTLYTYLKAQGFSDKVAEEASTTGMSGTMRPSEGAMHIMSSALGAFNPIGGDGSLLRSISPDVLDPLVDLSTNRDWKGDAIIPEPSPFAPYADPDSERHWQTVHWLFEKSAKGVNRLFGGNEVESGELFGLDMSVSPETLEHLMEHFTGGAGSSVFDATKFITTVSTGEEWKGEDIPVVKRFIASPSSFYELEKFKELREKAYQAKDLYDLYITNKRKTEAVEHKKLNSHLFKVMPSIKSTEKTIRKINKSLRLITASTKLTNYEKMVKIRQLKKVKRDAMRKTHSRFINIVDPI